MKKLLSFVIVALMMVSSIVPVFAVSTAPAAPDPAANAMNIWVQDTTLDVEATDEVTVTVNLSDNNDGFTSMKVIMVYPPCLEKQSISRGKTVLNPGELQEGDEKDATKIDKVLSDFFDDLGLDAETILAGGKKCSGPLIDCISHFNDEDILVDNTDNGALVTYKFKYDASKNTEGLTELPLQIYANALHCEGEGAGPYAGESATIVPTDGKITLLNVPQQGEEPNYTEPTIEISSAEIKQGTESATFEVKMYNNPGIWAIQTFVVYPEDAPYAGYEIGDVFTEGGYQFYPAHEDEGENLRDKTLSSITKKYKSLEGDLTAAGINAEGKLIAITYNEHTSPSKNVTTENGTLYKITLNTSNLAEGEYDIGIVYASNNCTNVAGEDVAYNLVQGKLTVIGCEHRTTENVNVVEATCTEDGGYDVKCTDECGQIIEHVTIQALGHNMTAYEANDPSCTEAGNSAYWYCSRCEKYFSDADGNNEITLADTVVPSPGHKPGTPVRENEVPAGCTTEGSYDEVVYCTVCEAELSRENKKIDPLDHDWVEQGTTGNCGEYGTIHYKCSRCNEEKTETGAFIDHDWQEVSRTEPTCTEFGHINYVCSRNAEHTKTDDVDPLGHSMTAHEAKDPSCTEEGNTAYWYCTRCEKYFSDAEGNNEIALADTVIEKIPHTPGTAVRENEVPESCTVDGSYDEVVYCTECGAEISRETKTIVAPGHTPGAAVRENEVPATCTEAGSYDEVVYCTVCNQELSRETKTINPLDHDYVATVTPPTCTEKGYTTYVCSRDPSHTYVSDYVDALDHDYKGVVTPPTCTEKGYTTYTCTRDASHTYVGDYVDALNHDLVAGEIVPPTCTEEGYTPYECTRCDYVEKRDIVPALNHDLVAGEVVPPTCKEEGYTPYECTRCDYVEKRDIVPKLEHTWDEGKITKEPTVDEEGEKTFTCAECGETRVESIPKLERDPAKDDTPKSPTTGYTTSTNNGMTVVFIAMIALVSGAAVVVAKKKLFNK